MNNLLKQIIDFSKPYLGVNAERFILRQVTNHLSVSPEQFNASKLDDLAKWVDISASLLIDKEKAKELSNKILALK